MPTSHKRTFSLSSEQTRYIDYLVSTGTYASSSAVICAGLRALQDRDAAIERWLRDEVVPTAIATQTDPERAISADRVFGEIQDLHVGRQRSPASDV